jgi:hypothetical protein
MNNPSRQARTAWFIRTGEILFAAVLAYVFRFYVDQLIEPLGLGNFTFLLRWLLLVLFIGAIIRLHLILVPFLKKKGLIPLDDSW